MKATKPIPQRVVDEWNEEHEVGTPVRYWTGFREGDGEIGRTTCAAYLLGGHTPVVMIDTASGCIGLTHVEMHTVYCHACSAAGGADRAIHHAPPACEA